MHVDSVYISAGCRRASACSDCLADQGLVAFAAGPRLALWDATSGGSIASSLRGHAANLTKVRFIATDSLVTGDDAGQLRLWRLLERRWTSLAFPQGHTGSVSALAVLRLADDLGDLVVSGSSDGVLRIWRARGDQVELVQDLSLNSRMPLALAIASLPASTDIIIGLATTDTKLTIFGSSASSLIFKQAAAINAHTDWLRALAFSVDDQDPNVLLLASGAQDHVIRLWRITQGRPPPDVLDIQVRPYVIRIDECAMLPPIQSGPFELSLSHRRAYTLRADASLVAHESWVTDLSWRRNEQGALQLLTTSADRSMILWRHDLAEAVWLIDAHFGELKPSEHSLGFFGAFSTTTTGGVDRVVAHGWSGAFHVWRRARGEGWTPEVAITGHLDEVRSVAWDPFGRYLLSAGADRTTRIHASCDGVWREVGRPQIHGHELHAVVFLGQHRLRIAAAADEAVVRTYEAPKRTIERLVGLGVVAEGDLPEQADRPRAAILPTLGLTTRGVDEEDGVDSSLWAHPPLDEELQSLTIWPETDKHYGHGYEVRALASSPDGTYLASSCKSASTDHAVLRIRHMPSNREVALPVDTAHSLTVSHIAFSANGRCLLTCSRDRSWRLYRVPETSDRPDFGFELLAVSDKAHTRIVYDCCFLAGHDDTFATASRDKTIKLWTFTEGKVGCAATLKLDEPVTALASTTCGGQVLLLAGCESGALYVYGYSSSAQPSDCKRLHAIDSSLSHTGAVNQLAVCPWPPSEHITRLATCGADGATRILDLRMDEQVAA